MHLSADAMADSVLELSGKASALCHEVRKHRTQRDALLKTLQEEGAAVLNLLAHFEASDEAEDQLHSEVLMGFAAMTAILFVSSMTDTIVKEVVVKRFPYMIDASALGLAEYVRVTPRGHAAPLAAFEVTGPGIIKVMPRWDRVPLTNTWEGIHRGNRRWYKEFMEFVMIPDAVTVPNLVSDTCGLRLCAVVLQACALSLRRGTHTPITMITGSIMDADFLPFGGRSWKGCVHAIRHHTTLSYLDSQKFVEDFLTLNMLVIEELATRILHDEMFENHFA